MASRSWQQPDRTRTLSPQRVLWNTPTCSLNSYARCVFRYQPSSLLMSRCLYRENCLNDDFSQLHMRECSRIRSLPLRNRCLRQIVLNVRDHVTFPFEVDDVQN
jgi:hypothetical protein